MADVIIIRMQSVVKGISHYIIKHQSPGFLYCFLAVHQAPAIIDVPAKYSLVLHCIY